MQLIFCGFVGEPAHFVKRSFRHAEQFQQGIRNVCQKVVDQGVLPSGRVVWAAANSAHFVDIWGDVDEWIGIRSAASSRRDEPPGLVQRELGPISVSTKITDRSRR